MNRANSDNELCVSAGDPRLTTVYPPFIAAETFPSLLPRGSIPMTSRINTVAFLGIDVLAIDVQVQISAGLPAFTKVGP